MDAISATHMAPERGRLWCTSDGAQDILIDVKFKFINIGISDRLSLFILQQRVKPTEFDLPNAVFINGI
jgi:hypothetical protein